MKSSCFMCMFLQGQTWDVAACTMFMASDRQRRTGKGGRGMQSLVSVTNPQQQCYRNRQSLAKTRHVCRCVCSTHLAVPWVCRGACNALFNRPPASAGRALLTPTMELHVQLKELATTDPEPTNSANWVLILLTSTKHLNFSWTPPAPLPKPQNMDQNPGREQILPGSSHPGQASVTLTDLVVEACLIPSLCPTAEFSVQV